MALLILAALGLILYLMFGRQVAGCALWTVVGLVLLVGGIILWGLVTFGHMPPPPQD